MKTLKQLEKKLLHYTGKAISDFNMIQKGDRILVGLSGGKDSWTLLHLLRLLLIRCPGKYSLFALTVDQGIPGWDSSALQAYLNEHKIPHEIIKEDTYSVVKEKLKAGKSPCSFCARLRRGVIYRYAKEHGFQKIALAHHRDDLVVTMMMSMMYSGATRSMPPKLLTDDKKHIVLRPMVYCQEKDIAAYSKIKAFPVISTTACGPRANIMRSQVKQLISDLALKNPKVPSNILHAIGNIHPSQLMDRRLWDFKGLDMQLLVSDTKGGY
ncbi:MAG: tRNA 2-thiocytidine(32) synthetase TtcA [Gammaproteobacteria bacterium]|nr:tRNA 2-thiocytidine(32) synthetase TtcA [Gammaproteobacteria bacterium]